MIKKIIMMMSAAVAMVCVQAATIYTETIDGIEWTYTVTDGEASVGGGNGISPAVPRSTSGEITIPSILGGRPVRSISKSAFSNCKSLTGITIPNSVASIGELAFYYCNSLTRLTMGDGVTSIGYNAFAGCESLFQLHISDISKWCGIEFDCFFQCPYNLYLNGSKVTSLAIPYGVKSISKRAFRYCKSLTSVLVPNSVTNIAEDAFSSCYSLASVDIGDGVKSIRENAFSSCSLLTNVVIGDGVRSIGRSAFVGCNRLLYDCDTIPGGVLIDGWVIDFEATFSGDEIGRAHV